jgi:hypothetical protein
MNLTYYEPLILRIADTTNVKYYDTYLGGYS